jgi:ABC-type dipeptide/oligopeptide/nickel transport system permease subunit
VSTGAPTLQESEIGAADVEGIAEIAARSPLELFWRRLRRDKVALVALAFIVLLVLIAIFAPLIIKVVGARPPNDQSTKYLDSFGSAASPSSKNLFGTDSLGRDVFSRTLYGARVSLEVAVIASTLIVLIGVTLGMIAGYYRGWVDTLLARTMDVMLAFPVLLLALGLGAACSISGCLKMNFNSVGKIFVVIGIVGALVFAAWRSLRPLPEGVPRPSAQENAVKSLPWAGVVLVGLLLWLVLHHDSGALITPGLPVVIFVIVLSTWPYMARIIRGQVLSLREKEFVEAARSLGASDSRIIFRHILPNLVAPIIVYTTLIIPTNILFEAALSFLGVGVQPPTASWGAMIADATDIFDTAWWYMTFPGLALLFTVLAFNLVGDGLQDALNPKGGR